MTDDEKQKEYFKTVFDTAYPEKERINAALDRAHEIRQFEIRLYWQRNLFFWGFVLAFFTGLAFVITAEKQTEIIKYMIYGITLLGFFTNYAWLHVEQGSKAWQKNWEFHIDFLEDGITGRLHKTTLGEGKDFFSVSKITQSIIWAFMVFWPVANGVAIMNILSSDDNTSVCPFLKCILNSNTHTHTPEHFLFWGLTLSFSVFICAVVLRYLCWPTSQRTRPTEDQKSNSLPLVKRSMRKIEYLNKPESK